MATRRRNLVVGWICVLALLLATAVSGVVETSTVERRPFKVYGDATLIIDWSSARMEPAYGGRLCVPWTMTSKRFCTEGWFEDVGEGKLYIDTMTMEGSGTCTESNGNQLTWESTEEYGSQHVEVAITEGIGAFAGVTGHYRYDYTVINTELDDQGNPTKLEYSFWGKGALIIRD